MSRAMSRFFGLRRALLSLNAAILVFAAMPGQVAAYDYVSESGLVGPYAVVESVDSPAATCGYAGPVGPANWIWLKWMTVRAPQVFAADRNSDKRDSRRVSWQFKIQRKIIDSPDPWAVVASSDVQRATAYDNQKAPFSAMKLYYTPKKTMNNGMNAIYRAMVIIKWIKGDGSVEGTAKIAPTYYRIKSPWSPDPYTGSQPNCGAVSTSG